MLRKLRALRKLPAPIRLLITGVAAGLTYALQLPLESDVPGDPFLLFFLVVVSASFAFGQRVGFVAVALTAFLAFLFFEPFGTLAIAHARDLIKIELYAVLAGISVLIVASLARVLMDAEAATAQTHASGNIFVRELSHRVANNFAVVAALIRRQAGLLTDTQARSVLDEAVEQVTIMARLHRHLQVSGDAVSVDSVNFIGDLCDDLQVSMARDRPVSIEFIGIHRALPIVQAVPLGLIVNELVTNALKHAFPNNQRGTVRVHLEQQGDRLLLKVEDDGVGMSDLPLSTGTGRNLIDALAAQLGGQITCRSLDPGTSYSLSTPFPPVRSVASPSAARIDIGRM